VRAWLRISLFALFGSIVLWTIPEGAAHMIGKIFITEWRCSANAENIGIVKVPVVEQRYLLLSCLDDQRYDRSIEQHFGSGAFAGVQGTDAIGRIGICVRSRKNWVLRVLWQPLFEREVIKCVIDSEIIRGCLTTILDRHLNKVLEYALKRNLDWLGSVSFVAQRANQKHVIQYSNVGSQLSFPSIFCEFSRSFSFVSKSLSFAGRTQHLIAEPIRGFDSLFSVFRRPLHFVQLAAQNPPLSETDARGHSRKGSDSDSRMRSKTGRAVWAGFLLLFGLAFMKGAFEATNQPDPSWGFRCASWFGWIAGFGTIGYGTLLALSVIGPISPLD
jgi:hypothetical protein